MNSGALAILVLHILGSEDVLPENMPFWNKVEHLFPLSDDDTQLVLEYILERLGNGDTI